MLREHDKPYRDTIQKHRDRLDPKQSKTILISKNPMPYTSTTNIKGETKEANYPTSNCRGCERNPKQNAHILHLLA